VDFKNSKCRWNEQKTQESASQLVLYGQSAKSLAQNLNLPTQLHFVVVTKGKKPAVQILDVPADPAHLAAVRNELAQVWEVIQIGNFYPTPSFATCCTCPFKNRCPVFMRD
jgi:hypothetical protein